MQVYRLRRLRRGKDSAAGEAARDYVASSGGDSAFPGDLSLIHISEPTRPY